jgi:capsular polysaccharide transport system permease protein
MAWISGGVALILAAVTEISDVAERMVQPAMYVALPFTGAFYMVDWLPDGMRAVVVYSPLVHASEMFRAGLLGEGVATHWDAGYLACSALACTAVGMISIARTADGARTHD